MSFQERGGGGGVWTLLIPTLFPQQHQYAGVLRQSSLCEKIKTKIYIKYKIYFSIDGVILTNRNFFDEFFPIIVVKDE